jgi:hypothetical protein
VCRVVRPRPDRRPLPACGVRYIERASHPHSAQVGIDGSNLGGGVSPQRRSRKVLSFWLVGNFWGLKTSTATVHTLPQAARGTSVVGKKAPSGNELSASRARCARNEFGLQFGLHGCGIASSSALTQNEAAYHPGSSVGSLRDRIRIVHACRSADDLCSSWHSVKLATAIIVAAASTSFCQYRPDSQHEQYLSSSQPIAI